MMIVLGSGTVHDLLFEHIHEGQQDRCTNAQNQQADKPATLCRRKRHNWGKYNIRPESPNCRQQQHENPNVRHNDRLHSLKGLLLKAVFRNRARSQ